MDKDKEDKSKPKEPVGPDPRLVLSSLKKKKEKINDNTSN